MKKSWEKILLAVLLALVAAAAVGMALLFPAPEDILGFPLQGGSAVKTVKPLPAEAMTELSEAWKKPPVWQEPAAKHELFIARRFFYYPTEKKVELVDGTALHDGISIGWLEKYRIPLTDNVALGDQDRDGFSNRLEYKSETDPTDAKSHPPFITRLRLKEYKFTPFRIKFNGLTELDGEKLFQLNLLDVARQKSRMVKMNDVVEGYRLKEYRPKKAMKDVGGSPIEIDVSELDMEREDVGMKVVLVINETKDSPDSIGTLVMLLPGEVEKGIRIKRGEDFALPQEPTIKYRLIDVTAKEAVLKQLADGKLLNVPLATPEEFAEVPGAATGDETGGAGGANPGRAQ